MDDEQDSEFLVTNSNSPHIEHTILKKSSLPVLPRYDASTPKSLFQAGTAIIQNFILIWLDANMNESNPDFNGSLKKLRRVVSSVTTFTDSQSCINFLSEIKDEKVFLVVSGSLGQYIVPSIYSWSQLDSIYVFCQNKLLHEPWTKKLLKVKGVYDNIDLICKALKIDSERCDQSMIPISFRGIDPLFMYTQLFKEIFLEITDDDTKSVEEFVEYCRLQSDIPKEEIDKVQQEYYCHLAIWWYTAPYFIYSMLNRGLRALDVDIIVKMGFFIRHLHRHIQQLHRVQQSKNITETTPFQVYRGQGLPIEDFKKLQQTQGGLMSFNNFLSTTRNRDIAIRKFARPAALNANCVGVLFAMNIDPSQCEALSIPFVDVQDAGYYKGKEEEILFSTHTTFRIDRIEKIEESEKKQLWQVDLTLTKHDEHEIQELSTQIREELTSQVPWARLGFILIKIGQWTKAEKLYRKLLEKASSNAHRAEYCHQLGLVYDNLGQYEKALSYYDRAIALKKKILPLDDPSLAKSYNNIGLVYRHMGDYVNSLSFYEKAKKIFEKSFSPNHASWAYFYNNIGLVYDKMGEYSKALSNYESALNIQQQKLQSNDSSSAILYNNIGNIHYKLQEYSKALSLYEKALSIQQKTLPQDHPDIATSYKNIAATHFRLGEHSEALSLYNQALQIWQKALPPTHPNIQELKKEIDIVKKQTVI